MSQHYLTEYSLLLLFVSLSVAVPIGMLATAKLGTKFGVTPSMKEVILHSVKNLHYSALVTFTMHFFL